MSAFALAPFHVLPVCFFTFPLLVLLLDGLYRQDSFTRTRQFAEAVLTGWSFGFGYFINGLWWLGHMMLTDGENFGLAMIPLAILGLPALMAAYHALAIGMQFFLSRRGYARLLALAFGFGLAEWMRGTLLTGFPWNAIGYAAMPNPLLMQIAALVGLYGVNILAVLIFVSPVLLFEKHAGQEPTSQKIRKFGLGIAISLACLIVIFGGWRLYPLSATEILAQATGTRVRLIQPSLSQQEKIDDSLRFENFNQHLQLTQASPLQDQRLPDLIVWPETSVPYLLAHQPEAIKAIATHLQQGQLALVGTVRAQTTHNALNPDYYNSLEVIDATGTIIAHADKTHLVPFGEYLPLPMIFTWLGLNAAAEMTGGYSAASHHTSIQLNEAVTILVLICYEAIFPTEMTYQGERANVLLNISNDAWYGTTPGPAQHFHQARLRAVEQGMPLVRSANNGISAVVDGYGRLLASLPLNETGFIDATVPPAVTPLWAGGPGSIQPVLLLASLLAAIYGFRRNQNP